MAIARSNCQTAPKGEAGPVLRSSESEVGNPLKFQDLKTRGQECPRSLDGSPQRSAGFLTRGGLTSADLSFF